jgi:hypothetical protein
VLRVRLVGGDHLDVGYDEPGTADPDEVAEHVIRLWPRSPAWFALTTVTGSSCCSAGAWRPSRWRPAARSSDIARTP